MTETIERPYPRYFTHAKRFATDAVYVRHDASGKMVVMTKEGERPPHTPPSWTIIDTLRMVDIEEAVELTADEADNLLKTYGTT